MQSHFSWRARHSTGCSSAGDNRDRSTVSLVYMAFTIHLLTSSYRWVTILLEKPLNLGFEV